MTKKPSGPSDGHNISGPGDRYEALIEVLEHTKSQAEEDRAREARARTRSKDRGPPLMLILVLLAVTVWLWVFPPGVLRLEAPEPQPLAQEESALRFTMYLQAQRIRAFRTENERLPETLDEAGPPLPGMQYTVLHQDLYQLTGATDRITLTYRSDLPLQDFLGSGADVFTETGEP